MADEEIVNIFASKQHPLQRNVLPGPKGAFELKETKDGFYIRIDMPGTIQRSVNVDKDEDNSEVHIRGYSIKNDDYCYWPFHESRRFYTGTIKVECHQNFDQVWVNHEVNNGTCRIFIGGVDNNAYFSFRTPKNSGSFEPHVYENHLDNPDKARIEGVHDVFMHSVNCYCCKGQSGCITFNGPWHEEDGRINPFIDKGMKGVFETKFELVGEDYYMYFRLDMPDCSDIYYKVEIGEKCVDIYGPRDSTAECILDDNGGREYRCRITLMCKCCSFDVDHTCNVHLLRNGVLRLLLKINESNHNLVMIGTSAPGHHNRLERDERVWAAPAMSLHSHFYDPTPASDNQCYTTATNKMNRIHLRRRHHGAKR